MSISSITTKVLSSLGNNTGSVVPIAAKDLIQNQVLVYQYHKDGGKYDAFEKFMEENGTSAVWLGGLPLIKKLFDKTVYKHFGINPGVDPRKLQKGASDSVEFTMNKLKEQGKQGGDQFKALQKAVENSKLTKGLFLGKFAAATGITMAALAALIMAKQASTKKKVENRVKAEMVRTAVLHSAVEQTDVAKMFKGKMESQKEQTFGNKKQNPSFTGNPVEAFMYNPIMNQMLLDGGITGLRTGTSRKGERRDILTKEGFEIAFLYPLALPIQKSFDVLFGTLFNKDTHLDYNVIASDSFKKSATDGSIKSALDELKNLVDITKLGKDKTVDKKVLNFIYDNPDNAVVNFLKDTGDVATVTKNAGKKFGLFNIKEATNEIDSLAFINPKAIKRSLGKLSKTVNKMDSKGAIGNAEKASKYINGMKAAKGLSVVSAIIFGIWGMGVLLPKVVFALRKKQTGSTENLAITNLENEIRHQMAFEGNGMTFSGSLDLNSDNKQK